LLILRLFPSLPSGAAANPAEVARLIEQVEETGQPELSDFFSKEESAATPDATHAGQLPPFAELA